VTSQACTEYRETGRAFSSVASAQLGLYGASSASTGEYVVTSDAAMLRYFLEDTHCFRVVDEQSTASLRLEGSAEADHGLGGLGFTAGLLESILLLPVFGIPVPDGAQGVATGRLYRDGQFVKSYEAVAGFSFGTTLYTFIRDERRAVMLARGMALRSLADRVAADLCRAQ
jgi:hypothetical protein